MTTVHSDGTRPNPSVLGSLGYLVMNLPVGVGGFVAFFTMLCVGVSSAVVWIGLPVLALAIVAARFAGRVERARVYAMLDTYIASPYPPLPAQGRWKARVRDVSTWRDMAYFLLLFPIGVFEFCVVVTFWVTSASMLFLPVYYRWLPGGSYRLWDTDHPVIVVNSFVDALPFTALGLALLALAVPVTRGLGKAHAYFARALLGPSGSTIRSFDALPVATGV
ncbi:sensor domain-containing protein [Actinokineospora enzanensis]|uniref:sensor domain-containing protein n=1 Tax=Actinokineospora enzanensis TaxID=155975 RepID=UPI0003744D4C|nr:sensor domain-containing protein [Actinokineospora enzanensis]